MTVPRAHHRLTIGLLAWFAAAVALAGQDSLARAKELYVQASYDEALLMLDRLHGNASPPESTEIAGYQVFCLLALGRKDEARQAIAALAKADPLYRPPEATTSPRTRAFFDEVRRGLLPGIVQDTYDQAKAAFDKKESLPALAGFERVLVLLEEPGLAAQPNMADLRRLASGFRDLIKTEAAAAAAPVGTTGTVASPDPAPVPPLATPPPASPAPAVYGSEDAGIVPPVVVSRPMPIWAPRTVIEKRMQYQGVLQVVIDEKGDVISSVLGKSVHPLYDRQLIETSRRWKFKPATKDGVPVKYRRVFEIRLGSAGAVQGS